MFLSTGEKVSVENLLKGIVTLSGNDACVVLAEGISGTEEAFANLMNQRAAKLGLTNSHFGNSNGWPDNGVTYVTARDLAKLAAATIQDHPQLYKKFYSLPSFTWGKTLGAGADITQANRDPLLGRVAGADGLKTGHTEEAGYGFTGSAEQNGRRLVMVMAGLTSSNQRIEESVKFMNWGFRAWQAKPIVAKGRKVETAEVQMGSASTVGLIAPANLTATLPAGVAPDIQLRVVYDGPIKAPIKAGQHIADLIVMTPDMQPQKLPLVAEIRCRRGGLFRPRLGRLQGPVRRVTTGRFISLEGGEGAGKSTQAKRLAEALGARGIETLVTREPGGSEGAEAMRDLLMQGDVRRWSPHSEALLFAAARADHVEKMIRPAVGAGTWVICDRFIDSSRAYQGVAGGIDDAAVLALHAFGSRGLLPDRTFVLEVPPEQGAPGPRCVTAPAPTVSRRVAMPSMPMSRRRSGASPSMSPIGCG